MKASVYAKRELLDSSVMIAILDTLVGIQPVLMFYTPLQHSVVICLCTGKVPDCERCHECFFQWHDIISSLLSDATALQASIEALITDNYNGYTVSAIESEVEKLLQQLVEANQSLSSITLQSEDIDDLERSLSEVHPT